jgi:DNA-binding transcriptional MerR regulator
MKKRYYIKDLAQILKVGRTLIYYWEATGKIPKAERTPMGNYRWWSARNVEQIKKIVERGR